MIYSRWLYLLILSVFLYLGMCQHLHHRQPLPHFLFQFFSFSFPSFSVWPGLAKFRHFAKKIKWLWQSYEGLFRKYLEKFVTYLLRQILYTIFHGCNWTNNENCKSHLVTLILLPTNNVLDCFVPSEKEGWLEMRLDTLFGFRYSLSLSLSLTLSLSCAHNTLLLQFWRSVDCLITFYLWKGV